MPIYTYRCTKCRVGLEFWLPIKDRDYYQDTDCLACGKGTLIRGTTSCSFIMKGACAANGYSTDVGDVEKFTGRQWTNEDNKN